MTEYITTYDVIIPISEYKYMTEYDEKFFEKTYPNMWKNVCLYVETHLSPKIIEKVYKKERGALESELASSPDWIKYHGTNIEWEIRDAKLIEAQKIMKKHLAVLGRVKYVGEQYIVTDDEQKEMDAEAKRRVREKYIITIDKNGIYAKIDKKEKKTVFKYKDGPKYTIDIAMYRKYKRDLEEREEEIIRQCAEAGLHYTWIAEIFGADERHMDEVCKRLGLDNVFITPQKLVKKLPKIRVFDPSGRFVIEKENHLLKRI